MKTQVALKERHGLITMKGRPLTLLGEELHIGDKAPEFEVIANDLSVVKFSSFSGKPCIITSVPSLDTSVCGVMTRRLNLQAGRLTSFVTTLTISMDLPFAQKRWCQAENVQSLQTFSDHRDASFGTSYGVLIKELRLLARAVFLVDQNGFITHIQIVNELSDEPDYRAILKAARQMLQ